MTKIITNTITINPSFKDSDSSINLHQCDCMEFMRKQEDEAFDLLLLLTPTLGLIRR